MIFPDVDVIGYVIERVSQTVDGGWNVIYDAAPLGYAGLKVECICNELGDTIGEVYRVAGHAFGTIDAAIAAWVPRGVANVFDLRPRNERPAATESRNNTDQLSRPIAASVVQTSTDTRRVAAAAQGAAVALSGAEGGQ